MVIAKGAGPLTQYACGFAAAQCGKALPYREASGLSEATPPIHEAEPQRGNGD